MLSSLFPRAHHRYASLPILGGVLDGLCEWLRVRGYPPAAIRRRVAAAPMLARLMQRRRVRALRDLTKLSLLRLAPKPVYWTPEIVGALVRSLAQHLDERGGLAPAPWTPSDTLVAAYARYLGRVRGLAEKTVKKHTIKVAAFLRFLNYDARPSALRDLGGADVERFVVVLARRLGRVSMQHVVATLRSFLRFLATEGEAPVGLDARLESPRCFRGERLPRAVPWRTVGALLGAVDRSTAKGRRDYAMLLLIATYGLRVSEVAALELGDVAWRSRQIRVPRPKAGSPLLLPLTDEVATALHDYLRRGRPRPSHRRLFLRVRVPLGPIASSAVCDAFDVWAARAGIRLPAGAGGPHCLRHSLAVHLLRQGAPLKTIGDLLGHRNAESTCVYLRLQVEDLRDVALPLPDGARSEVRP